MPTECNYLYGVVPANGPGHFGPVGIDGGEVRSVRHGELAIVASPADRIGFSELDPEKTLRYLAEHQRVLERVMADSPVVPLKFGTCANDEEEIVGILQSGKEHFTRALARYAGKIELDVVTSWADLDAVLAEIAREKAVVSTKAEITAAGKPTAEQCLQLGQLVKTLLDQKNESIAARLVVALRANWPDIAVNSTKDDSMILNAAVLIDRSEEAAFDQAIDQLNRSYEDRLNFRCVGPLPPYSFATAEVKALDADELDAARQALELGERANLTEIKAAHRRLLREHHPDKNADAGAAEKVKEVSAAYELLEEFALNFKHTFNGPGRSGLPVVRIRSLAEIRQELTAQAA